MKRLWQTFGRVYEKTTERIGFAALTESCGTTHLALAAANYFASKERRSVLYVECTPVNGVIGLRTEHICTCGSVTGFECAGVHYMPVCSPDEALELLAADYDVIIVEGQMRQNNQTHLFARCDRRIFTLCAKPWHYPSLRMNLKHLRQQDCARRGSYCSFGLTEREERLIAREFQVHCSRIPYIEDPFRLKPDDLWYLKRLLRKC